jgi:hypothetical protein
MYVSVGIGGTGLPYWSIGCRRPDGPRFGAAMPMPIPMVSEPFPPALLTVLSEGLRWFKGVLSSVGDGLEESKYAALSLARPPEVMVSPDMGGGDSALGNSVVRVALLARFA